MADETIWIVFEPCYDGDGYTHWNYRSAATSFEVAYDWIVSQDEKFYDPFIPEMNAANHWTVQMTREAAAARRDEIHPEGYDYRQGGGFVIEQVPLLVE